MTEQERIEEEGFNKNLHGESNFPDSYDVFRKISDLQPSDKENVRRFQELWNKDSRTPEEENEMNRLQTSLKKYTLTATDINLFQNAVTQTQKFFNEDTQGYVNRLQIETTQHVANEKTSIAEYIDLKKAEVQEEIDKFKYQGTYNNTKQYFERNIVDFNDGSTNQSYMALENVKGIEPTDNTKWLKLTIQGVKGERGADGMDLKFQGAYDENKVYNKKDGVQYGGFMFGSLVDNNKGQIPDMTTDTDSWARALSVTVTTTKLIGTRNLTTNTKSVNFMTGEIIAFNPAVDSIEVYKNSIRLTQGIDYKLGIDNKSIEKITSFWEASMESPIFFEFVVLKNILNDLVFSDGTAIQDGTVAESKLELALQEKINEIPIVFSIEKPTNGAALWFEEIV